MIVGSEEGPFPGQRRCFLTYGDERFEEKRERLAGEARGLGVFDEVLAWSREDLPTEFTSRFREILSERRGGGYWIWKPFIVDAELRRMGEDDILVYADAGCIFVPGQEKRLFDYFDIVNESPAGILSFQGPWPEYQWTKKDLWNYFGLSEEEREIYRTGTLIATAFVVRKCPNSQRVVSQWLETLYRRPDLFTDAPSEAENDLEFRENRHDQAVFSILRKREGTEILPDEINGHHSGRQVIRRKRSGLRTRQRSR